MKKKEGNDPYDYLGDSISLNSKFNNYVYRKQRIENNQKDYPKTQIQNSDPFAEKTFKKEKEIEAKLELQANKIQMLEKRNKFLENEVHLLRKENAGFCNKKPKMPNQDKNMTKIIEKLDNQNKKLQQEVVSSLKSNSDTISFLKEKDSIIDSLKKEKKSFEIMNRNLLEKIDFLSSLKSSNDGKTSKTSDDLISSLKLKLQDIELLNINISNKLDFSKKEVEMLKNQKRILQEDCQKLQISNKNLSHKIMVLENQVKSMKLDDNYFYEKKTDFQRRDHSLENFRSSSNKYEREFSTDYKDKFLSRPDQSKNQTYYQNVYGLKDVVTPNLILSISGSNLNNSNSLLSKVSDYFA
jgi:hypothetical protein